MAQDSIAYGESLLADIRKRNSEEVRRREKEAKKDKWKALGMKTAIGIADSVLESKHQNFLNQEAAIARKTGLNQAIENGQTTLNDLENIKTYAGGKEQYILDTYTSPLIKEFMSKKYAPGTVNEVQLNVTNKKLAKLYNETMVAAFDKEAAATKSFFDNNDVELYNANRKQLAGASTIKGGLTNIIKGLPVISSLTGDLDKDTVQANQEAYRLAAVGDKDISGSYEKSLKGFQEVFDMTQSTGLADFVMENIQDSEGALKSLGSPALVYTHVTLDRDIFDELTGEVIGKETVIQQIGKNAITGVVESFSEIRPDGSVATRANTPPPTYIQNVAALIGADKTTEGSVFLSQRPPTELEIINDRRKKIINKGGYASLRGESLKIFNQNQDEVLAAQVVLGGIDARNEQIGSRSLGNKLAFQLQLMDAELPVEQRMNTKVGKGNIFNTLKAYSKMYNQQGTTVQVAPESIAGINNFFEKNFQEAYNEITKMNSDERLIIFEDMGMNEKQYEKFNETFPGFEIFKKQAVFSLSEHSFELLELRELEDSPPPTDSGNGDSDGNGGSGGNEVASSFDLGALPVPPPRASGTFFASPQKKEYGQVMRLDKKIKNDEETLAKFKANPSSTKAQISLVETRIKRNKALLAKNVASYTDKYAPAEI